jgi:hypothetical protein
MPVLTLFVVAAAVLAPGWGAGAPQDGTQAPPQGAQAPPARSIPQRPVPDRSSGSSTVSAVVATPTNLDLGFMRPNETAVGTVTLRNTGTEPVRVLAVTPSCKCTTTTDIVGKEIPAGGTATFDTTLEGAPVPGVRTSTIRVVVEGATAPIEIKVKGEVSQAVRAIPAYLNCVGSKNLSGRLVVESIDKRPFRILSAHGSAPVIGGWDPASDEPRSTYLLSYDLGDGMQDLPSFWIVETDHPDSPLVDLKVRHESVSAKLAARLADYRANAGRISPGMAGTASFTSMDPQEPILSATSLSPDATIDVERVDAVEGGTRATITVKPRVGHEGLLIVPATLSMPTKTQEVLIFATVRPAPAAPAAAPAPAAPAKGASS